MIEYRDLAFPKYFLKYITTDLHNRQNCIGVLHTKRSALLFQESNLLHVSFLIGGADWFLKDIQIFSSFTSVQFFCQLRSSKWLRILSTLVTLTGKVDLVWEQRPTTRSMPSITKFKLKHKQLIPDKQPLNK